MLTVFFTEHSVTTLPEAEGSDTQRYAAFFHAMLERGVYLPPSQFEAWMISSTHDGLILEQTIETARQALQEIAS
jgi:glutamate-1-semialdehyde 2,1-aminomutase